MQSATQLHLERAICSYTDARATDIFEDRESLCAGTSIRARVPNIKPASHHVSVRRRGVNTYNYIFLSGLSTHYCSFIHGCMRYNTLQKSVLLKESSLLLNFNNLSAIYFVCYFLLIFFFIFKLVA